MKKILFAGVLTICLNASAQIAVGKKSIDGSGILDFAQDSGKVIVLPIVDTLPNNPMFGILVGRKSDSTIVFRNDTAWIAFSPKGNLPSDYMNTSGVEKSLSTIVGSRNSSTQGVLVLESIDKALILPKSDDIHLISNPRFGSIAYDKVRKSMAIYNGKKWTYWK